jgi:hypothetical protein
MTAFEIGEKKPPGRGDSGCCVDVALGTGKCHGGGPRQKLSG